jgi:hypothetical protein
MDAMGSRLYIAALHAQTNARAAREAKRSEFRRAVRTYHFRGDLVMDCDCRTFRADSVARILPKAFIRGVAKAFAAVTRPMTPVHRVTIEAHCFNVHVQVPDPGVSSCHGAGAP